MTPKKARQAGFTLIELLVVISIIALLISILVPALSAARAQGHKLKCVSNLRSITTLALTYAHDDPNGIMGPVHPSASLFTSGEGYAEYGGGPGTMPFTGWNDVIDPRTRPLNRLQYGDSMPFNSPPGDKAQYQIFQCPGEEFGWQEWPGFGSNPLETETPYFKANGVAFRMNNLAFSDGTSVGIYGRPVSRIPQTANTLAFLEARAYQTLWTNNAWGSATHGELTGYHKKLGYFNLSYADGHAKSVDMGNDTYYPHQSWTNPMFNGRDARGTWGRMDCLPELLNNF